MIIVNTIIARNETECDYFHLLYEVKLSSMNFEIATYTYNFASKIGFKVTYYEKCKEWKISLNCSRLDLDAQIPVCIRLSISAN